MAKSEDSQMRTGPVLDLALCRCCWTLQKCRLLTKEYEWMGTKEVYSDMIVDCFGLHLSHLVDTDSNDKENCICAKCVTRLRDATAFRQQVLYWEEAFLQAKKEESIIVKAESGNGSEDETHFADVAQWNESIIVVKAEPGNGSEDDAHWTDDAQQKVSVMEDTKPLLKLKIERTNDNEEQLKKKNVKRVSKKQFVKPKVKKIKSTLSKDKPPGKVSPMDVERRARERKMLRNTETIVTCSYAVPFQNRFSVYYCFYCLHQFTDPAELREHTLTHDPAEFTQITDKRKPPKFDVTRIDCRLCPDKIDDMTAFREHASRVHGRTMHGDVTDDHYPYKLTLTDLVCVECGSVFPYFDSLKRHMAEHFGKYTCESCGVCFIEEKSLHSHFRTHNKASDPPRFQCEVCAKSFQSKYSRQMHVLRVHEKTPTFNCYKCEESFMSSSQRNEHLVETHDDTRTFRCQRCDKVFKCRRDLKAHYRRCHQKESCGYKCDLCDKMFTSPSDLKEHRFMHTGERNFSCEYCDKRFARRSSLRLHTLLHTHAGRFKCDACGSVFTYKCNLQLHIKRHHRSTGIESGCS